MVLNDRILAWGERLYRVVHRRRTLVTMTLYGLVTAVGYGGAFLLRFELAWPGMYTRAFWLTLPVLVGIRLGLARAFRLSTRRWRFLDTEDVLRLVLATVVGSVVFFVLTWVVGVPARVPRSVVALEWVLTTYGTAGMWLVYLATFQRLRKANAGHVGPPTRVLMVGAGEAGAMLVRQMVRSLAGYVPVGFVDDDRLKWGTTVHGVEVLGPISDIRRIAEEVAADELIIAIPSAGPARVNEIVEQCEDTNLSVKILPGITEVLSGHAGLHQVRRVEIEDLLGREPVSLELPRLAQELQGKCVRVTGAAGSIGLELRRQIAIHRPARLILLDQAETPLVELDLELRDRFPEIDLIPAVRDVTDRRGVEELFREHRPHQVFHAAAYKHVPMMELNPVQAFHTNVVGTLVAALAAGSFGAEKFVLVSTDKAVRPVNVMGATKRLAEMIVQEAQERFPGTAFAAVRFGNVLGSSGSVIPRFRKQIAEGRPLTVTHPEITRYFMTIPEAVQLILQASLLPDMRGQVAMLDMGEPVKILDLARKILRLSGIPDRVGENILFTGLRPGEKLHEELVAADEDTLDTEVEKIRIVTRRAGGDLGGLHVISTLERAETPLDREEVLHLVAMVLDGRSKALV